MLFTVANNELQYRWALKLRPLFWISKFSEFKMFLSIFDK